MGSTADALRSAVRMGAAQRQVEDAPTATSASTSNMIVETTKKKNRISMKKKDSVDQLSRWVLLLLNLASF